LGLSIFVLAFGLGYFVAAKYYTNQTKSIISTIIPVRQNNLNNTFIYPLLSYNLNKALPFLEDHTLEASLDAQVQSALENTDVKSVSIYTRNLLNNQWAGVNEDIKYHPASLMKVLIMMAYYRQQQADGNSMQKLLTYTKDVNGQASVLDVSLPSNLVIGRSYTVHQLIENMVETSDNGAKTLLVDNINEKVLTQIMTDLNIGTPDQNPDYVISPREYTAFLRILYNATYLTEADSEEALSIMAKSTFKDGISAGLPSSVLIAQKYGESIDANTNDANLNTMQLSDCGIVYAKNYPYVLCVMTKAQGSDRQTEAMLSGIIKNVSQTIYQYVDAK
jgi:beta-lactamase class A